MSANSQTRKHFTYKEQVSRSITWGHYFIFINILLSCLLGYGYVYAAPPTSDFLSFIYLHVSWLGHMSFLTVVAYLVLFFPLAFIGNYRLYRVCAVAIASVLHSILLFDLKIFLMVKVHLSVTALNLIVRELDFDTGYNELTLTLTNTGNAGNLSWNVSGLNVAWLTIQPAQGEIAMGKSAEIKVLIDRSQITASQSTSFIINAAGGSQSVRVLVSTQGESGGNEGGDEGETGGGDYSSAEVMSCDSRIEAAIVSCERSGSAVVFTYTLKNTGLGLVNDFRIHHPEALGTNDIDGSTSLFYDNEGNEYSDCIMTFRDVSKSGSNITASFPENIACKGTVTIKNVPADVDEINVALSVLAYPNSEYNLAGTMITFEKVPVY